MLTWRLSTPEQFVLVIATTVEVVLLGVEFENDSPVGDMRLHSTHVSYPTDGIGILQVLTTRAQLFAWLV